VGRKSLTELMLVAMGAGVVVLAQNSRSRQVQPNPDPPQVEAPRGQPGIDPNVTGVAVEPNTYAIGPLDILYVKVFAIPTLQDNIWSERTGRSHCHILKNELAEFSKQPQQSVVQQRNKKLEEADKEIEPWQIN
jgi:hypothetical protein